MKAKLIRKKAKDVTCNAPTNKKVNLKSKNEDLSHVLLAAEAAEDKKGENIVLLDVSKLTTVSDYFLVVTANSTAQIQAIAKHVENTLKDLGLILVSKEGFVASNWVVVDFGNIVVHIMTEKERDYYKLERFWSNATIIDKKLWQKAS